MGAMFSPGSPLSGSRTHQHISVMQSSVQHSDENLALSDSDAELYALLKTAAALAQPGIENTVMVAEVNDGFFPMAHNLYLQLQVCGGWGVGALFLPHSVQMCRKPPSDY